ncbi:MAG: DUF3108 domain-containing protein [Alphaproteobacteria bacterium]|nr:DUF3108 domain-containing protein [Alphaproteobacteria bacterium]MBU2084993.1 DUF3108 domain-containing protein [Alphaproteobacteria bacterium]MBU2143929.1 DUF3108 domain-containing protein [Alphaproteobacteria bacterium]MBU2198044.1 DUF3108 domain-containing protein [Alphaproteobacteria bacterium]
MKRASLLASGLALAMAGIAVADTAPDSKSAASSLLASVKAGTPTRMIYELEAKAYVLFIPATGRASFTVDMQPENYVINSRVKVTGIADWFINYDMVLQASGYTRDNALKTYSYVSQNRDGKKNRHVNLTIGPDSFKMKADPEFGNLGDPAATTHQVLKTNDPITALITFALEPREAGADPCGGPIRIFDGRQLTYLHLKNAGMKQVKTEAWSGNAIECHVTMEKVAGYKKGESNKDNLSGIDGPLRMWLAPLENGATVPVKIQADTDKIGKITLQAKKLRFEPIVTEEAAVTPGGG